ncbi:hypothetical protein DQ04_12981010 [Trypanosoma grayi]|uniref:hypothetical protein n=1 Tax=Trypanosoma grayi TaxID=71804 RepID=UPI0004F41148|nr:hypothetical protein DQ04_12981010 [Trypanosoma grayi]KEG06635.1 hypothetical protein DQ04_12981010 [Trypanosoma grayi]
MAAAAARYESAAAAGAPIEQPARAAAAPQLRDTQQRKINATRHAAVDAAPAVAAANTVAGRKQQRR